MPRGIYKRKKKVGRPNGRKNKKPDNITLLKYAMDDVLANKNPWIHAETTPTEPPSYLSRLEAATVKYEQAINEAIEALKGQ